LLLVAAWIREKDLAGNWEVELLRPTWVFVDFPKGKSTQFFGIGPQIQDVDGCILQDNSMVNLNYQVLPAGSLGNVYATIIEITESPHMLHAKIAGNVWLFGYPHFLVMIFVTSATDSSPMSVTVRNLGCRSVRFRSATFQISKKPKKSQKFMSDCGITKRLY
jgi:hypothetical protein